MLIEIIFITDVPDREVEVVPTFAPVDTAIEDTREEVTLEAKGGVAPQVEAEADAFVEANAIQSEGAANARRSVRPTGVKDTTF